MSRLPLILGHRGASALAPENTLAAFSLAMESGADGIEFDVRLSRDNVPVVIHDANLRRTGLINRNVAELTARELQRCDVGSWFGQGATGSYAGEGMPLLTDVFDLFQTNHGMLYVEMKCDSSQGPLLAAAVCDQVRKAKVAERVVVESFDHDAIVAVKKIDPAIRTAALFEPKLSQPTTFVRRKSLLDRAIAVAADEIALHRSLAQPRIVQKAKEVGIDVVVWTVDEKAWVARARRLGIKALIANDPAALLRHRDAL